MRTMAREALKALKHGRVNAPRTELVDELVVVNRELLAVGRDLSRNVPGRNNLSVRAVPNSGLYCGRAICNAASKAECWIW
jgi:hypothetical protein